MKKNLQVTILDDIKTKSTDIELLGVNIRGLDREINCFGIYRRPGRTEERKEWRKILNKLKQYENIILVGDYNAHNMIWNCAETVKNGEILQEEMEEIGFLELTMIQLQE